MIWKRKQKEDTLPSPFAGDIEITPLWRLDRTGKMIYEAPMQESAVYEEGTWTSTGWNVQWIADIIGDPVVLGTVIQVGSKYLYTPTKPGDKPRFITTFDEVRKDIPRVYTYYLQRRRKSFTRLGGSDNNG